jgi:hypothetical protein
MIRRIAQMLILVIWSLTLATAATATPPQSVAISTTKQVHSPTGTWSAFGTISDSGTFTVLKLDESALSAPAFVITHVTYEFESTLGTFTLKAEIKDTFTDVPGFFTDQGTWVIRGGTGAYATLQGQGGVVGFVDHTNNIVSRTYSGKVHLAP